MNVPRLPAVPIIIPSQQEVIRELPIARRQTVFLATEDLSTKLCVEPNELYFEMRRKELNQRYHLPYTGRGTKLDTVRQCRSIVIDWMDQVGQSYALSNITISFAVTLLDRVLGDMDISRGMLQLVATACILIAAKNEEMDEKVPSIVQLNHCTDNTYTSELIKQMEALILNKVQWDINLITPIQFLGFYLKDTLRPDDLLLDQPVGAAFDRVRSDIASYSEFFVDLCRQEYEFLEFKPSIIAASSVAVTRKMLRMSPIWSETLEKATGYDSTQIQHCCDHIWSFFEANFLLPGSPRSFS